MLLCQNTESLQTKLTFFSSSLVTANHFLGDFGEYNSVFKCRLLFLSLICTNVQVQLKQIQLKLFVSGIFFFFALKEEWTPVKVKLI